MVQAASCNTYVRPSVESVDHQLIEIFLRVPAVPPMPVVPDEMTSSSRPFCMAAPITAWAASMLMVMQEFELATYTLDNRVQNLWLTQELAMARIQFGFVAPKLESALNPSPFVLKQINHNMVEVHMTNRQELAIETLFHTAGLVRQLVLSAMDRCLRAVHDYLYAVKSENEAE